MNKDVASVMCRTCLNYSCSYSNIFTELLGEGYVFEVLKDVCQLEVNIDDGLPEYVCLDCHKKISEFHFFKLQSHEGNCALHRLKIDNTNMFWESSDKEETYDEGFSTIPKKNIEPSSCSTWDTPDSSFSLKSTRNMKPCYVRLSRCDHLLKNGQSDKLNLKKEREDPLYLSDSEVGTKQVADMQNIEQASSSTCDTPDSSYCLKSTTRSMKECYVRLSRCDQLLQNGQSVKFNIRRKMEEPIFLGDNESGMRQEADIQVVTKEEFAESLDLDGAECDLRLVADLLIYMVPGEIESSDSHSTIGCPLELPLACLSGGEPLNVPEGSDKGSCTEEIFPTNVQSRVKVNKDLCNQNLFSNRKEFEGDDIEMHEEKLGSEDASLTCLRTGVCFTDNSEKGMGNLTSRDEHFSSDGKNLESEPLDINETLKSGSVGVESNVQLCEEKPEEIISKFSEASAHTRVELKLGQVKEKQSCIKRGLKNQEGIHLEDKPFKCEICGKKFSWNSTRKMHYKIHEMFKNYQRHDAKNNFNACCSSEFFERDCITESEKMHTKGDALDSKTIGDNGSFCNDSNLQVMDGENSGFNYIVTCEYCSKEFHQKTDLLKHLVTHSQKSDLGRLSAAEKTTENAMREHDKLHVEFELQVESSFCKDSNIQLREEENGDFRNILVCEYCREEFHEKSDLLKHLVVHCGKSNFCRLSKKTEGKGNVLICISDSTKKRGSKKCKRRLGTKNQWKCNWCGKEFSCASNLKTHERVHTGEKPFSCKYCSRKFSIKGNLSQHELTHTGIKPFSCSYCSKSFYHNSNLNRHVLIHTGVKPFSCKFCSKKFSQKSNLNKHELIHTGVKPFSLRFRQKAHLKVHERIHTRVLSCS